MKIKKKLYKNETLIKEYDRYFISTVDGLLGQYFITDAKIKSYSNVVEIFSTLKEAESFVKKLTFNEKFDRLIKK